MAVSLDWKRLLVDPSVKATPTALPDDIDVYSAPRTQSVSSNVTRTIFASVDDYLVAAERILSSETIEGLETSAQRSLFVRFGARVAIGRSYQEDKWQRYALAEAKRMAPPPLQPALLAPGAGDRIHARYDTPSHDVARFAVMKTLPFAAAVPYEILRGLQMTESGYVTNMAVSTPLFDKTVENGITDPVHKAVMVDCMEGDTVRNGVGYQWLRQTAFLLDVAISRSSTSYNDMEFARRMPDSSDVTQDRLDYPSADDTAVLDIASTKAARYAEILSGRVIMPTDRDFGSPAQGQQELLLRRVFGTFPNLGMSYFHDLTRFRQEHEGELPVVGEQVLGQ